MTRRRGMLSAVGAATLLLAIGTSTAQAEQLAGYKIKCFETIAKEGGKLVAKALKATQKCRDYSLNDVVGDECTSEPAATIDALKTQLVEKVHAKCNFTAPELGPTSMKFPGKCLDPDPADAFTAADLETCESTTHPKVADDLIALEYGDTASPINDGDTFKCQQTIAKNGAKFVKTALQAIQKCRNGVLNGDLTLDPMTCATNDPTSKTQTKIAKAESKTRTKILDKCSDDQILALDVCPGVCSGGANLGQQCTVSSQCPGGSCGATTDAQAADCIIATHTRAVDNTDPTVATLIDFEYAAKQPVCGDNVKNAYEEECDGPDNADCPGLGLCGTPGGLVACLCLNRPRERIWEHANADLDNGWTGDSHDSGVVEGGGYVADLYDCDGKTADGGTDPLCTVGPSCAVENPPASGIHAPCAKNADCGAFGPCRKRRTAVGPHCALDVQVACESTGDCSGGAAIGNVCVKTAHGAPLPISGGGVSVCVVNLFKEDVTGTRHLDTGEGAVFMRQSSVTHLGPSMQQPCPVCGGFCGDPTGGARNLCSSDNDCKAGPQRPADVPCVTSKICSFGPKVDQPCRPNPPYGGGTDYFGNTSVDCPPDPGQNISGSGLDIIWNPVGTGTTTQKASFVCNAPGFGGKECVGGPTPGKTCTTDGDCGLGGTCNGLCFCPQTGGGTAQRPNRCNSACVGGETPGELCAFDTDCGTGFCHLADCVANPIDSSNPNYDGICSSGPVAGVCEFHPFKTCIIDGDCGGFGCPFCTPGETCVLKNSQCFVSGSYTRVGIPNETDPIVGAVYCIQATTSAAINNTAGLPGPGAIRQWENPLLYGFTP